MAAIGRFLTSPKESFFLFGPRGTGKSTWARSALPEALWIDLLDPETLRRTTARPESLRERLAGERGKLTVVIDEVQRAPELLSVVHALIEERRGLRFVLTGSSARKLRRGTANLLAGRALVRSLHPFMAAELEGAALEGLVFQHLRAWNAYRNERNALAYWRTRNGREVDFVLHGPDAFAAIEVKNARRVHPLDAQGLRAFRADYPESRALLLYRGKERAEFEGGVEVLPVEEFLLGLKPSSGQLPG
jgi:predicted AAA+ superfamily ATPase